MSLPPAGGLHDEVRAKAKEPKEASQMSEHAIGSREQWLEASKQLLEREKESGVKASMSSTGRS